MAKERKHHPKQVTVQIKKKRPKLAGPKDPNSPADTAIPKHANANSPNNKEETKCYIYRVHDHLRKMNSSAYEPQILAIGPYHHGKGNTTLMEKHKLLYGNSLFLRKNVDKFRANFEEITEDIKQNAASCYADSIVPTDPDKFTRMMLSDGCFIIELLLRNNQDRNSTQGNPIFETEWMLSSMQRDLMLFENQIPFFVLCKLFNLVEGSNSQMLLNLILKFFKSIIPGAGYRMPPDTRMTNADDIKHLLHLIHIFWSPDSLDTPLQRPGDKKPWRFVSAVTKLKDANVKFGKNDQEASLFDITFKNGTLKLSHLLIEDETEDLFRNLIAYEQYFTKTEQHNFATDYVTFLDTIIDSPGDVEILRRHGIIENWLGSDKVVSNIFNKLADSVIIKDNFIYNGVCNDMKKHCKKRKNNWMAMLWRIHFRSPWAILAIIAGVVLLLLTAVQAVCSVLQLSVFRTSGN